MSRKVSVVNSLGPGFGGSFGRMNPDCVWQGREKEAVSKM